MFEIAVFSYEGYASNRNYHFKIV